MSPKATRKPTTRASSPTLVDEIRAQIPHCARALEVLRDPSTKDQEFRRFMLRALAACAKDERLLDAVRGASAQPSRRPSSAPKARSATPKPRRPRPKVRTIDATRRGGVTLRDTYTPSKGDRARGDT